MLTVVIALTANATLAVLKSIVAVLTGSASMVAEAAHSWADAPVADRGGGGGRLPWAYLVLGAAFVLESVSFFQARREV